MEMPHYYRPEMPQIDITILPLCFQDIAMGVDVEGAWRLANYVWLCFDETKTVCHMLLAWHIPAKRLTEVRKEK